MLHQFFLKKADNIFLKDNSDIKKAREYWQTSQNPSESLKKFPKNCFIERNLLKGIEKFGIKQITNAFSFVTFFFLKNKNLQWIF